MSDFKYKLDISSIKAENLRAADVDEKNVGSETVHTTQFGNDEKNNEWHEKIEVKVGVEEYITIIAMNKESKIFNVIGQAVIYLSSLTKGQQVKKVELEHKSQASGQLTLNLDCQINPEYEKSSGIKGRLIVSNMGAEIEVKGNAQKVSQMDTQCALSFEGASKSTEVSVDGGNKPYWVSNVIFPVKDGHQSVITFKVNSTEKKEVELGSGTFDAKDILSKSGHTHGISVPISLQGKVVGKLSVDLEYRLLDQPGTTELDELKKLQGSVVITNMKAKLTRDTEVVGKMDPYARLKMRELVYKTAVQEGVGKEPIWKEHFEIGLYSYMKEKVLEVTVLDEDVDSDDIVGSGTIDLAAIIGKSGNIDQTIKLAFEGKQAGEFSCTVAFKENAKLKEIIAAENAKKQAEIAKKEAEDKKKKEEELAKKKAEEENLGNEQKKKAAEEAEKVRLAKAKEDEERKKKELEQLQRQKEQEEQAVSQSQNSFQKNKSQKYSSRKFDEYNVAAKNFKNGFGMSEFQSAHTLQNSVVSTSFPKGKRFSEMSQERSSSSPYTVLPSIFDSSLAAKKGASFGYGNRGFMNTSANPGPGAYELSQKMVKKYGVSFGESRESCKNSIAVLRVDVSQSIDYSRPRQNIKLPSLTQQQIGRSPVGRSSDPRLDNYPQFPSTKNFHYSSATATK